MFKSYRFAAVAVFCALSVPQTQANDARPDQLVIISFDGAHDNRLWQKSRDIAQRTGARFTYFLSCTFLMTRDQRWSYQGPAQKAGRSNIGFARNEAEVLKRLDHIWQARSEGHEMGSHACGHFDGGDWSERQWRAELSAFSSTLENAWSNAGAKDKEPEGWRSFVRDDVTGFRAPYLSTNSNLNPALKKAGYTYDASGVSRDPEQPRTGLAFSTFDLPLIPEGPRNRRVIAMDYNLFVRHSAGVENAARSEIYEARAYSAFRRAFDRQYEGRRRPLQIGFHFVEMNGGAYWRAMERLLSEVCDREDVACISYAEALETIKAQSRVDGA
ncbi:polysaccharide deacetylase family protein [Hoeflea poritis]|uniref:Chitooligosaccharide deacetylase n=1 Tax=Hoeflea poritis TaxID=2993659 RepID=A0ABT4VJJ2_9HYPH|nr:polysaccharide deacetylase family protein [Hoeflea poritis]MDA4844892.1 polysaccharide deacetylase [Hoeflea poritis]